MITSLSHRKRRLFCCTLVREIPSGSLAGSTHSATHPRSESAGRRSGCAIADGHGCSLSQISCLSCHLSVLHKLHVFKTGANGFAIQDMPPPPPSLGLFFVPPTLLLPGLVFSCLSIYSVFIYLSLCARRWWWRSPPCRSARLRPSAACSRPTRGTSSSRCDDEIRPLGC